MSTETSSDSDGDDQTTLDDSRQWKDAESDEEKISVICLACESNFPEVSLMLKHCKIEHQLDLVNIKKQLDLDFLDLVKLVNYFRSELRSGNRSIDVSSKSIFEDARFLLPALEDDALLFNLDEITEVPENQELNDSQHDVEVQKSNDRGTSHSVAELQDELQRLQQQFAAYRKAVDETLEKRWNSEGQDSEPLNAHSENEKAANMLAYDESQYFTSYSYNDIHETMLKDTVRTDAYRDFIYENKNIFNGKVVLDVGCGTGILSMFCVKSGAAKVIAVDNSDIIDRARENVFNNGFGDTITCLRGKIEEVSLPVSQVDIIISEWMGYCLLYEAMLDSILWARDRYLSPGGLLIPSNITLFIAPLADPDYVADHVSFWRSVYGFNMQSMLAHIYDEVIVRDVEARNIAGIAHPFFRLDLYSITTEQLEFANMKFTTRIEQDIDNLDGFVIWFDTFFLPSAQASNSLQPNVKAEEWAKSHGIAFTTGPGGPSTHWRQGVCLIDHGESGSQALEKGVTIDGTIGYKKRADNQRALDIEICWEARDIQCFGKQEWSMR